MKNKEVRGMFYRRGKQFFAMALILVWGMNVAWSGGTSYAAEAGEEVEETFQDSQGFMYSTIMSLKEGTVGVYANHDKVRDKVSGDIVIPETITSEKSGISYKVEANSSMFKNCKKITSVVFPSSWDTVPQEVFLGCTSLKSVTLTSNDIKQIESNAFEGCKKLQEIKNIEKVQGIYERAFLNCTSLKKLNLNSVTFIDAYVFSGCKNLINVTIGGNFKELYENAFSGCKKLKTIVIKSTKVKKVNKKAFSGTSQKITIKVPKKKLKAYTKLFKNKGNKKVVVKAI
jgi:hypothetical protein